MGEGGPVGATVVVGHPTTQDRGAGKNMRTAGGVNASLRRSDEGGWMDGWMDVMDGQAERRKLATELSRKIQGCNRQELAWRKGNIQARERAVKGGGLDGLRSVGMRLAWGERERI